MRNKAIYVGSLWHEDCDPFVTVVALTESQAQVHLDYLADDEFRALENAFECPDHVENDCDCEPEDTIRTGGVFQETLGEFSNYVCIAERREKLAELLRDGVCFL